MLVSFPPLTPPAFIAWRLESERGGNKVCTNECRDKITNHWLPPLSTVRMSPARLCTQWHIRRGLDFCSESRGRLMPRRTMILSILMMYAWGDNSFIYDSLASFTTCRACWSSAWSFVCRAYWSNYWVFGKHLWSGRLYFKCLLHCGTK